MFGEERMDSDRMKKTMILINEHCTFRVYLRGFPSDLFQIFNYLPPRRSQNISQFMPKDDGDFDCGFLL
jgi:hypothetical protein